MLERSAEPVTSLYVHVPFCARKCSYCAFFSQASSGELINRYVRALIRELELVAADLKPRTVFFGGGTPSLLNLAQWEQILDAMGRLGLLGAEEWTVESNPATVSLEKARLLRSYGVNRMSIGVQSLNPALLERLGRIHSREMAFTSYAILRQAGFDNVNLDLMFAIPGQTLEQWRETLTEATALGPEHLSCYEVIYEEDTPLFAQLQAGEFSVDEDLACAMYEELVASAANAGLEQYEIANFARNTLMNPRAPSAVSENATFQGTNRRDRGGDVPSPAALRSVAPLGEEPSTPLYQGGGHVSPRIPSRSCLHYVNYWRGGSFYGLGPSGTSYVRGVRSKNWSNTELYCEQLEQGRRAIESREELPPLARAGETAAFGLRMVAGWPFEQFRRVTGHDLRGEWSAEMTQLVSQGWGQIGPDAFRLTHKGLRFADAAAQLFLR